MSKKIPEGAKPFKTPEELHHKPIETEEEIQQREETLAYARYYGYGFPEPPPTSTVDDWQQTAREWEKSPKDGYVYPAIRREKETPGRRPLETYHNESLIGVLHTMLDKKTSTHPEHKTQLKVLDVGGGAGIYAEQIRKEFGEQVRVYTTGLKKQAARLSRHGLRAGTLSHFTLPKGVEIDPEPHRDDLKWRSILQLHDFPEFDLIVDTAGEFAYSVNDNDKIYDTIENYLTAVIHKLVSGGYASISFISEKQKPFLERVLEDLRETYDNVEFIFFENPYPSREPEFILKVIKK